MLEGYDGLYYTSDVARFLSVSAWKIGEIAEREKIKRFGGRWDIDDVKRIAFRLAAEGHKPAADALKALAKRRDRPDE